MNSRLKMNNRILRRLLLCCAACCVWAANASDSIPAWWQRSVEWNIGAELSGACVPGTNNFLRGVNDESRPIDSSVAGALRFGFGFNPDSREGRLYRDLYQGIAVDLRSFFAGSMLGTPASVYIYQGAPIKRFSDRLWLGYEWRFGAAFGWKHYHDEIVDFSSPEHRNDAVSTPVTAHMGLSLKLNYRLSERWRMSVGIDGEHFSNGNTSWPNAGVNTLGGSVGVTYILNPKEAAPAPSAELEAEADRPRWLCDFMFYGAWRKRQVRIEDQGELCPGRFGVVGLQIAPMRKFNRWVAAGIALDMQFDESAGLAPYWVEYTSGNDLKFYRPPFGKQLSAGVSAHAELTMPIFSVNAGVGYDFVCPQGNQRFYQSLSLKTFVSRRLFLNVGYRLGNFKYPQNLMLGIGVRL